MIITFVLTTAAWGALAAFALRRVAVHLQKSLDGIEAITKHMLLTVLGQQTEPRKAEGP